RRRAGRGRGARPRRETLAAAAARAVRSPPAHASPSYSSSVELGLFPLGIVLLPTERVPLHIFEQRYKELIGGCLEDGHEFGLVYADESGLRHFGTRARVTDVLEEFDDGRMNVIVEGGERFRLLELTSGRSFHTGRVEGVDDEQEDHAPREATVALGAFRALAQIVEAEPEVPAGDSASL